MALLAKEGSERREPLTDIIIHKAPSRIIVHRSHLAVDLTRAEDNAIYLRPEQSWGRSVWAEGPVTLPPGENST